MYKLRYHPKSNAKKTVLAEVNYPIATRVVPNEYDVEVFQDAIIILMRFIKQSPGLENRPRHNGLAEGTKRKGVIRSTSVQNSSNNPLLVVLQI